MAGRFKNVDWDLANSDGKIDTWERVSIAVLMDIRDELRTLNRLLACPNFQGIPSTLNRIARKIPTRKRKPRST